MFSHIQGSRLFKKMSAAFMPPVLHSEWLRGKLWDLTSARKNVSLDKVSNLEIWQTWSRRKAHRINSKIIIKTREIQLDFPKALLPCSNRKHKKAQIQMRKQLKPQQGEK